MSIIDFFSDKITIKIWDQYFSRVEKLSKSLEEGQRKELILELQDHLLESFKSETSENEAERMLNAIEKMGDPQDYIKPIIADYLLSKATNTFNPKTIFKGLYFYVYGGIKKTLISIAYGLGYLFALLCGLMAVLKIFFPNNIGLFLHESGEKSVGILFNTGKFGIIFDETPIKQELLGFWVIPITLLIGLGLYVLLTKKLQYLKREKTSFAAKVDSARGHSI